MHVVATAGHVDHGKSTLIQALTGQQPDRLRAERERGLSIELGYCWTELPRTGDVAFVDVPGHERFVSTMLAGVGAVPCVMFVVAADDPWMPQAAEHLDVIDALGIRHGVLVVTRADLGDPDLALQAARSRIAPTTLRGIPDVVVSGHTRSGLDRLRTVLDDVLVSVPPPRETADVRLWVDRAFSLPGAGTVVTGTLAAGEICAGDRLLSGDHEVKVRGLECLERPVKAARGVARVALRLGSGAPPGLGRGSALVTPDAWTSSASLDVRVEGIGLPQEPMLHVGSASVPTRVRVLLERDGTTAARLTLTEPLPWHVGDRVVLRDPGRRQTWGADVIDPSPPQLTRRGDGRRRGEQLIAAGVGVVDEVSRRQFVAVGTLRTLGHDVDVQPRSVVRAGEWVVDRQALGEARAALRALVEDRQRSAPLDGGVPVGESVRALALPDNGLLEVVVAPPLVLRNGRVSLQHDALPGWVESALALLSERFATNPFNAPTVEELADLHLDTRALAAAARAGRLLKLTDNVVLGRDADQAAVERLGTLPQPFTASEARQALGTSRRVALPLLDHLDRAGLTVRHRDDRRSIRTPGH